MVNAISPTFREFSVAQSLFVEHKPVLAYLGRIKWAPVSGSVVGCGRLVKAFFVSQLWDAALCAVGLSAPTQTGDAA